MYVQEIWIGSSINKNCYHLSITDLRGKMQRRPTIVILNIRTRARFKQLANGVNIAL